MGNSKGEVGEALWGKNLEELGTGQREGQGEGRGGPISGSGNGGWPWWEDVWSWLGESVMLVGPHSGAKEGTMDMQDLGLEPKSLGEVVGGH